MSQRYTLLRGKIEELESILNDALLKGSEARSHDDIKQKLAFIGKLLSAEVAAASSSNPSRPHHLHHISKRLAKLEKAFHARGNIGGKFFNGEESNKDSAYSDGEGEGEGEGVADDDTDLIVFEGQEKLYPDLIAEEKAIVEFRGDEKTVGGSFDYEDAEDFLAGDNKELVEFDKELGKDGELERAEERRAEGGFGKTCCCALDGAVMFGMFLMGFIMVNLFGGFHNVEQPSFLVPT